MSLRLSTQTARLVEQRLERGDYASADELIREALEALRFRDDVSSRFRTGWRGGLDRRYVNAVEGAAEWVDDEDARRELRERHEAFRQRG